MDKIYTRGGTAVPDLEIVEFWKESLGDRK